MIIMIMSLLKTNSCLDKNDNNYPSVDHKISVMYGFINNKTVEEIGGINNLCITKRYINSMKFTLNEREFISKINNNNEKIKNIQTI